MFRNRRPPIAVTGFVVGLLAMGTPAAAVAQPPAPGDPDRSAVVVERAVSDELAADGAADFWVVFDRAADLSGAEAITDWAERGRYVYRQLTETAQASQAGLRAELTSQGVAHESFWIANAVLVRGGDGATLDAARSESGVAEIRADRTYRLPDPIEPDADSEPGPDAVEWGIANIRAEQVWDSFGVRGEGMVVGNIDSGVQFDHPALVNQYRGNLGDGGFDHDYNWWDPSGVCPEAAPCDNNSHGTHTMGTMVGDDGAGNQIGVAPAARWIAAKGCEARSCSQPALLSAGQFMLAPTDLAGANPRPELRPHVVNNSWGDPNLSAVNPFYRPVVTAWTAAGIFGVFSNGNEGPGCDTTGSPADLVESWAVGAHDSNNTIASFSSRGPGEDGQVRPNLSAPGVAVRSSLPGDGYGLGSGTSMAAPHQSGTVALVWSAALSLTGEVGETRQLLARTAIDTDNTSCGGTAAHNNVYGEGRLDAFAAVDQAPRGPTGILAGTVSDRDSGAGVGGATIVAAGADTFTTIAGPDGAYRLRLPVGSYLVTAESPGYRGAGAPGVEITEDQTTTQNLPLEPVAVITVDPPALAAWQRPDETSSQPLTIGNDGAAGLDWAVAGDGSGCGTAGTPPWAAVDPASGSVAPGQEQTVQVVFDSAGLPEGELAGEICLAGNDPDRPAVVVSVTLRVDQALPEEWVQRDKLVPADRTEQFDGFGWEVVVDGDTAVVLACGAPGGSAAYVYTRTGAGWTEQAKLTPSSPDTRCSAAPFFPIQGSVAIDGDTVVLGLPLGPDFAFGSVTVFARSGAEWTEQAYLTGPGYGLAVAVDGDTAVTATAAVDASTIDYHVLERDGTQWSKVSEFAMPDNLRVGFGPTPEIALAGDTALISRFAVEDTPANDWRAAIFARGDGEWTFEAELAPSDGAHGLAFAGDDVSLDGDTAVVTASREGNNEGLPLEQSAAYVFTRGPGGWSQQQKLLPDQPDDANWRAVDVDGDRVVVGAEDVGVHMWNLVGDTWRQHTTVVPAGSPNQDVPPPDCQPGVPCFITPARFGRSVGIDGDNLVVSTYPVGLFGSGNGPAYLFDTGAPAPTVDIAPQAIDFGGITVEDVSDSTAVLVENQGSAALALGQLSRIGAHPGDFLVTDDFCSGRVVQPGTGCTFEVRFTPASRSLGPRTARVEIPSNAATAPDSLPVAGEGLPAPPEIDLSPDRILAGGSEGSVLTEPFLITNQGTLDLAWSTFPGPGATEGLTLRAPDGATEVGAPPAELDQPAGQARITTSGAGPAVAAEPVSPTNQVAAPGTVQLTHSRSLEVQPNHTVRCGLADGTSTANRYLRTFTLPDFALRSDLRVSQVTFGVEDLTVAADLTVNLYLLRGDFTYANLDRLATASVSLQPQAQSLVSVPVSTVVPAGSTLVMEVAVPDLSGLGNFSAGSNPAGESAPSYLSTTECGVPEPTPFGRIGFPDTHLVMTVSGTVDCGAPWLGTDPGGGTVAGGDNQLAEVTLDTSGLAAGTHTANLCLASNDPRRQLTTVPVTLEVTEREPVTFDSLRNQVAVRLDSGEVTRTGAKRLTAAVDRAEDQSDDGDLARAIQSLRDFQRLAADPKLVPGPAARDALTADAERLIAQLGEQLNDPGATAPVARQQVPI